jgi:hypothetical protein
MLQQYISSVRAKVAVVFLTRMLYNKYKFARPLWTERVHRGFLLILQGMFLGKCRWRILSESAVILAAISIIYKKPGKTGKVVLHEWFSAMGCMENRFFGQRIGVRSRFRAVQLRQ